MVKNQVMPNKVSDSRITDAMLAIPRHMFVPQEAMDISYIDTAIPLLEDRHLLRPDLMARMIQTLDISAKETVLDIGCGMGYSSAILCKLAKYVYAVESIKSLAINAANILSKLQYTNIALKCAPLLSGNQDEAPYGAIFINTPLTSFPETLFSQLKKNKRMVFLQQINDYQQKIMVYQNISNLPAKVTELDV